MVGRNRAEPADRGDHPLGDLAPDAARPEVVAVRRVDGGDRHLRGRERGLQAPVEREALERVVLAADAVEVAAEPARREPLVCRADLPEVPRGEVRLVGVVVADAGHHAHLALAVQLGERRERRMPAQRRVLRECRAGALGQRQARPQLAVERVAGRREQRERIGAAVEEHRDEHLPLRRCGSGGRDALVEQLRPQRRAAVDGEGEADAAGDERPPVEPGACRHRHPRLDRRQPAAGLGEPSPDECCA